MRYTPGNQKFLACQQPEAFFANNNGVFSLHPKYVFVEFVTVCCAWPVLRTLPKTSLASICSVENISLDVICVLRFAGDLVDRIIHELRKVIHWNKDLPLCR
jgi:hypothetical protein